MDNNMMTMKNNTKCNRDRQRGFTLIEMMIVIGIVAFMAAIAVPNIMQWRPNLRLKQGARDLLSVMQQAKLEAAKSNRTVVVAFTPAACPAAPVTNVPSPGGSYRVFVDDGGGVVANANNFTEDAGELFVQSGTMPQNVALCSDANGHTTTLPLANMQLGFTSQGLPLSNRIGTIEIVNDQNQTYELVLSIAGVVRLQ